MDTVMDIISFSKGLGSEKTGKSFVLAVVSAKMLLQ